MQIEQIRKLLDKAFFEGYSKNKYPRDEDIEDYLNENDEITIYDYLGNGHLIAWFSDLYNCNPVDDVAYDCTEDRFLTKGEMEKL